MAYTVSACSDCRMTELRICLFTEIYVLKYSYRDTHYNIIHSLIHINEFVLVNLILEVDLSLGQFKETKSKPFIQTKVYHLQGNKDLLS